MAELRAFVGHSFLKVDEDVVRIFLGHFDILAKADISFSWDHAEEAEALSLVTKILEKIEGKNLFIAICTRKELVIDNFKLKRLWNNIFARSSDAQWKTSDWIIQEIGMAVGRRMSIVLFLEEGVRIPGGLFGDIEYISFNRDRPKNCFDKFLQMLTGLKPKVERASEIEAKRDEVEENRESPNLIDLDPKPNWTFADYRSAAMRTIIHEDFGAFCKIDASFKTSEIARGDIRIICESTTEHFKMTFSKNGSFDKIKRIADENPNVPEAVYYLGWAYEKFHDFAKAAENMEAAGRLAKNEETKINYLGQAAFQCVRADQHKRAGEILNEVRKAAAENPVLMPWLVSALKQIADFKKDATYQIALLEHEIEKHPNDTGRRFALAYLHSQNENTDMALFHYQRIPADQRDSVTWNNLGVSYGEFGMPVRGIGAFRKSADDGSTLAMSNIGNKFLASGFFEEADEYCKRALTLPNYHKNVSKLLSRLNDVRDEEREKLESKLDQTKIKAAFYREVGNNAVLETPKVIATNWVSSEGALVAELVGDQVNISGFYEVPASRHLGIMSAGFSVVRNDKYKISYLGSIRGRIVSGTVARTREGGALTLFDGVGNYALDIAGRIGMVRASKGSRHARQDSLRAKMP